MSDADELAGRDPADEPPNAATGDSAAGSDGFTVAETPLDPLDGLAQRVKADPGAPFKPDSRAGRESSTPRRPLSPLRRRRMLADQHLSHRRRGRAVALLDLHATTVRCVD